jgi:xylulokinase
MLQGIVEGVTHEMKAMMDRLETVSDISVEVIRAFGGPTRSPKWLQLKADISGKKVEAVQVEEASALGAAILAGVATGVYDSYEQAIKATVKIKAAYQPRPEIRQIYERQHAIYKQLVEALNPVNKGLYYI